MLKKSKQIPYKARKRAAYKARKKVKKTMAKQLGLHTTAATAKLTRGSSLALRWESLEEKVIVFVNCNLLLNKECRKYNLAIQGSKVLCRNQHYYALFVVIYWLLVMQHIYIYCKVVDVFQPNEASSSYPHADIEVDCGGAFISPGFIDWQVQNDVIEMKEQQKLQHHSETKLSNQAKP